MGQKLEEEARTAAIRSCPGPTVARRLPLHPSAIVKLFFSIRCPTGAIHPKNLIASGCLVVSVNPNGH